MKPNFALNLSHDGISVFFRAREGWERLGAVALDAPDFDARLTALRHRAMARAGAQPLTSKLVIPASQVLYKEITAPGPHAAARRAQIAAAIEGLTPYALEDLVFDWSGHGAQLQVAIVARETLAEAEAFAEDRGFAPVSFVAVPEPGQFAGEPWFGPCAVAPAHLPEGARIERDQDPLPLSLLSGAQTPAEPATAPAVQAAPAAEAPPKAEAVEEALAPPPATPEAPEAQTVPAEPGEAEADMRETGAEPEPSETGEAAGEPVGEPVGDAAGTPAPEAAGQDIDTRDARIEPEPEVAVPSDAGRQETEPDPETGGQKATGAAAQPPDPGLLPAVAAPGAEVTAPGLSLPPDEAERDDRASAKLRQVAEKMADARLRRAAQKPAAPELTTREPTTPEPHDPPPRVKIAPDPAPETIAPERTPFGAPKGEKTTGKPKHPGLVLSGALVGFLVIVALWTSFLSTEPAPGPDAPLASTEAAAPEVMAQAPAATALPATPQAEAPAAPTGQPEAETAAVVDPETAPEPPETSTGATPGIPASGTLSTANVVVQGLAPLAPLGSAEAQVPTPSPAAPAQQTGSDAGTQAVAVAETVPGPAPDPASGPASGPASDLGEDLVPTAAGVAAPGGFTLYAGKPPRVPRARPDSIAKAAEAARIAAEAPPADPALKGYRPKPRPASVAAAAAAPPPPPASAPPLPPATQFDQQGALMPTGPSPRLSSAQAAVVKKARPKPRPETVLRAAAAALPPPAEPAPAAAAAPAAFPDASSAALTVSRRPLARPHDFSGAVENAVAAAIAATPAPATAAAPQQTASAAPVAPAPQRTTPSPAPAPTVFTSSEESSEPEPTPVAPKVPISASVARQATQKNVIDLGQVSLIGLYGTPNNRRALVRMPNGRFYKVAVGDRLDGGRVTAIGENQMTYQKGNRPITLKLARGG